MQQLPPVLRRKDIYAFFRCFLKGIGWLQERFTAYRDDVTGRLACNGLTANLEKFLNDKLGFEAGTIYVTDYRTDNLYLSYYGEVADNIYASYQSEGDILYLSSTAPDKLAGGFAVMIPRSLASERNLATIRQWVEYYRYAGTAYKIMTYE